MSNFLGRRVVVIGAGIAGLSAAGALAGSFEQVEILERDRLSGVPTSRPGTPQDRHPHVLLPGGLKAFGEIFPGFEADLAAAGAVAAGMSAEVRYERPDIGMSPARDFGLTLFCASRALIEFVLRRRAAAIANIVLRPECRVLEILPAKTGAAGVRFVPEGGRPQTLPADLVVDASGRGAPSLALLDTLGWERPAVTEIGIDLGYATAVVPIPVDAPRAWKALLTLPDPPHQARYGGVSPREGGEWTVVLATHGPEKRPARWKDFLETAAGLTTPTIHQALRHAVPPAGLRYYAFPASRWVHFERLAHLPRGVLPLGDAICRFNPIYGQGMSAAAKQARLLQDVLGRAARASDPIVAAQAGFMAEVTSVIETPWNLSTGADLAFPATRGERPEKFEEGRQFEAALFRAVVADPVVHRAVTEIGSLLQPQSLLQEPEIQRRIEAAASSAAA